MHKVDYDRYNPVITISLKGKLLVAVVRMYYRIRQWLGKDQWKSVQPNHHEDPLKMTFDEKRYLGYKYYFKALIRPEEGSDLDQYFAKQDLKIKVTGNFIVENTITLHAGGDLMPYTCITPGICTNLWNHIGSFFFGADIVFANLETPADFSKPASATPEVMLHDMYFNADENMFNIFNGNNQYKGFDVVSIANNHSLDFGKDALLETMQMLQQKNIAYCGGALNKEAKNDFPIIERKGIRIAFLAATFSFNKEVLPKDEEWLCNYIELNQKNPDIHLLKEQAAIAKERGADMIVAALHMGCAYQAYPNMHSVINIHQICDETGIDIIIAGHPHHAQPLEIYHSPITGKQHVVVYSLGDFIAYDIFKWGHLSMMLQLEISKGTTDGKASTHVTGLKIKPVYMHAAIKNGSIASLELLNYLTVKKSPSSFFKSKKDLEKFEEVSDFFERFVVLPHQEHILI